MLVAGPFGLGPFEMILILVIVMVLFGVGRLPEVGAAIGRSIREFRKATKEPEALSGPRSNDDAATQTGGGT